MDDESIAFLAEQLPILPPADDTTFTETSPLPNISSSVADANGCTSTPRFGPGGTEMKVTNSSAFKDFDLTTFLDEHTLQVSDIEMDDESIAFLAEQLPILPPADDTTFTETSPLPNISSSVADANGCTSTPRFGPGGTEMKVTNSSAFEDFDLTTFLDEHTLQVSDIEMDDESIAFLAEQLPILPPADDTTFTETSSAFEDFDLTTFLDEHTLQVSDIEMDDEIIAFLAEQLLILPPADDATFTETSPLPNISSSVADADGCTSTPRSGGTERQSSGRPCPVPECKGKKVIKMWNHIYDYHRQSALYGGV